MRHIAPRGTVYRLPRDERREPLRLGRIVYLLVIGAVVVTLLHMAIGHLYLLRGEGFVFSENRVVALEFDASIVRLDVRDGDGVEAGQSLLRYDSFDLRRSFVELSLRIGDLERQLSEAQIQKSRLEATIDSARRYNDVARGIEEGLGALRTQGLVGNARLSTEAMRRFEAERDLLAFVAERDQIAREVTRLSAAIADSRKYLDDLIARFADGRVHADRPGVVADLTVAVGSVAKKTDPLLRVFSGRRFLLAYLDEASPVARAVGDRVIVRLPGRSLVIGRIARLTLFADRLPEEFQPRFKPAARQRLVAIDLEPDVLEGLPVLTTASLYRPLGLEAVLDTYGFTRRAFARVVGTAAVHAASR
jgi:multidrug resistance efflux pump